MKTGGGKEAAEEAKTAVWSTTDKAALQSVFEGYGLLSLLARPTFFLCFLVVFM